MNAVEIEQAITDLAEKPFDPATFPYAFLEAFGNKETTIKRLRAGASNKSDLGGVLQTNNIHILTCDAGQVQKTFRSLKESPATARAKAKFVLATDGTEFEAEDVVSGETVVCAFKDFPDHFGFFLPLAGISTVRQISENAFDIRATSRLNRLYVELLKDNPEWGKADRRHDMNHFMARLIFCFFAEDTNIFVGNGKFTEAVAQMSAKDSSNTHEVISALFRAMNTKREERAAAKIPRWADDFPYVNGGLFSGSMEVPRFSKIARSYLVHVGSLDWTKINPDIFGSMIQAVADDEERGELGMHYTSVPNILKVLNPLFLDDLRAKLEEAADNSRMLLNLRRRISKIRIFDPACGSGNFLVIAYKEMRAVEAAINKRRGEPDRRSGIPLTNFRGIELRDFPAEVARLALIIAEYQCDVLYRGQKLALAELLPLRDENWITCGNALRLDWLSICPSTGTGVKVRGDNLFQTPLDQAEIDFENEGGETYICGNPQFKGARRQSKSQKDDLCLLFDSHNDHKDCDYVIGWFIKAGQFAHAYSAPFAFVATNSVSQGEQVSHLWSRLYALNLHIFFAYRTFLWSNNASHNAGVHCVIVGVKQDRVGIKRIYEGDFVREVDSISPYLIPGEERFVEAANAQISGTLPNMYSGNMARDGGHLILTTEEATDLLKDCPVAGRFLRPLIGTKEINQGIHRYCLWINDDDLTAAEQIPMIANRIEQVRQMRAASPAKTTRAYARTPHKFAQRCHRDEQCIAVPKTTTGESDYITANIYAENTVITDLAFVMYPMDLISFAIISSSMHAVWTKTVAGGMRAGLRYSSQLAYHTFPVPLLTEKGRADLRRSAEDILLSREHHFPATIADLYNPDAMPEDLRAAHDRNDEVLERIYIGRRFKNDTERLEKLFDLYTKMAAVAEPPKTNAKRTAKVGASK